MNNRYGCYNRIPDMKCGYLENATDAKCKGCRHLTLTNMNNAIKEFNKSILESTPSFAIKVYLPIVLILLGMTIEHYLPQVTEILWR